MDYRGNSFTEGLYDATDVPACARGRSRDASVGLKSRRDRCGGVAAPPECAAKTLGSASEQPAAYAHDVAVWKPARGAADGSRVAKVVPAAGVALLGKGEAPPAGRGSLSEWRGPPRGRARTTVHWGEARGGPREGFPGVGPLPNA